MNTFLFRPSLLLLRRNRLQMLHHPMMQLLRKLCLRVALERRTSQILQSWSKSWAWTFLGSRLKSTFETLSQNSWHSEEIIDMTSIWSFRNAEKTTNADKKPDSSWVRWLRSLPSSLFPSLTLSLSPPPLSPPHPISRSLIQSCYEWCNPFELLSARQPALDAIEFFQKVREATMKIAERHELVIPEACFDRYAIVHWDTFAQSLINKTKSTASLISNVMIFSMAINLGNGKWYAFPCLRSHFRMPIELNHLCSLNIR